MSRTYAEILNGTPLARLAPAAGDLCPGWWVAADGEPAYGLARFPPVCADATCATCAARAAGRPEQSGAAPE